MQNKQVAEISEKMKRMNQEILLSQSASTDHGITEHDGFRVRALALDIIRFSEYYGIEEINPYEELAESWAVLKHMFFAFVIEPWALPIVKGINWLIRKVTK